MKNSLLFSFLHLILIQHTIAQTTEKKIFDSLYRALPKAKEDTVKVNLIAAIMDAHVYYKPEEGLAYQKTALELCQKLKWDIGIAKIKDKTGRLYWRLGNFDKALNNHFEALDFYRRTGNQRNEGNVLLEIGQDYLDKGVYPEARTYLLNALKTAKAIADKRTVSNIYDKLIYWYNIQGNTVEATKLMYESLRLNEAMGNITGIATATSMLARNAETLGNYEEALKFYKQSLEAIKAGDDKIEEASLHGYIANIYVETRKFQQAQGHYASALELAGIMKDAQLLGELYRSMGNMHRLWGNYEEALKDCKLSEEKFKSVADRQNLAGLYAEMGMLYTGLKNYNLAKQSFAAAMEINKQLNSSMPMADYYSGIELLDSATGNWKDAYLHHKKYVAIKDSSFNKETLKKLVSSQMQYESEKKEPEIKAGQERKDLLAKEEIKRQLDIRNASFAVLAAVLAFSIIALYQRNKLAREKKRSDQLLQDKELLLREIHHRVKNNLEVVSSLLALQSAQIDDTQTKDAMQESQNRVQSIGIVHQKLYQGTNLGAIEMKDYFINLSESILDSFGAEKRVTIECAMDKLDVDIDTAVPLGLIVNELLTNTLKYAFPQGQHGNVQIKLQKKAGGILQLEVSDNGVGKSGVIKGTGFGGQLVSLLTQQLNGSMREEVKDGTKIYFEFKTGKAA
jgi:two-component system, sensor histidine kinase PdtaS